MLEAHEKAMAQERNISHLESEVQKRARRSSFSSMGFFERGTQGNHMPDDIDGIQRNERSDVRVLMTSGGNLRRPPVY